MAALLLDGKQKRRDQGEEEEEEKKTASSNITVKLPSSWSELPGDSKTDQLTSSTAAFSPMLSSNKKKRSLLR